MGTSTGFGGGKNTNPLIPTWLSAEPDNLKPSIPSDIQSPPDSDDAQSTIPTVNVPADILTIPTVPVENRFNGSRRSFTSLVKSGNLDVPSLRKAISSYVSKTAGGSRNAAKRMSSERSAGARLGSILASAGQIGIREVIKNLNFHDLANRSTAEIYAALVDKICEPGGDLDESYARDAYIDAVVEIMEMENLDLDKPTAETISIIMELFVSNTIMNRIMNDVATKIILLPDDTEAVFKMESQLKDFVRGIVSDEVVKANGVFTKQNIDKLYERSFAVLQGLKEQEENK
ncbi:MAG: Qat anti-phage system associated protein QatB [Pseudomonadota bacterium]